MKPRDKDDLAYLWDMLNYSKAVLELLQNKHFPEYCQDRQLQWAVERAVEIVGEAASRVSNGFKSEHPEIPWRPIVSQRNVLAHEYGEIENELIWKVSTIDLPVLIEKLEKLISK